MTHLKPKHLRILVDLYGDIPTPRPLGEPAARKFTSILKSKHPKVYTKLRNLDKGLKTISNKTLFDLVHPELKNSVCRKPGCSNPTKFESNCKWAYAPYCSRRCCLSDPATVEVRKNNMIRNHGVTNCSQLQSVKDLKVKTCLANHGVCHPMQSKALRKKSNYGVNNPSKSSEIQSRKVQTSLARYGVTNPMYNADILTRSLRGAHRIKTGSVGGKEFSYMGYELYFIEYLHNELGIPMKDITTKNKHLPYIDYLDRGRWRKHLPDLAFKYKGKVWIVEVKSTYTGGLHKSNRARYYELKSKAKYAVRECNYAVAFISSKGDVLKIYRNNFHETKRSQVKADVFR